MATASVMPKSFCCNHIADHVTLATRIVFATILLVF